MLLQTAVDRSAPASYFDVEDSCDAWQEHLASQVAGHPLFRRREIVLLGGKGHVVLTGIVSSFYEKQLAQEILRRCEGVDHIDNRLEVDYSGNGSRRHDV